MLFFKNERKKKYYSRECCISLAALAFIIIPIRSFAENSQFKVRSRLNQDDLLSVMSLHRLELDTATSKSLESPIHQDSFVLTTWQGPGADWFTGANWSAGTPGAADDASFMTAIPTTINIDAAALVRDIIYQSSGSAYTLAIGSTGSLTIGGSITNSTEGNQNITIASGGVLTFNSGITSGAPVAITNDGSIFITSSNASTFSITNNVGATFDISGVVATANTAVNNITGAGNINLGTKALSIASASGTISGVISGTGAGSGLSITSGTLTLSGINTYQGETALFAGTLSLSGDGTVGTGSINIFAGSTFNISAINSSVTVGAISGNGTIALGARTLVTNTSTSTTYNGGISGSGTFTKQGAGTLTLTGNLSASGYTGTVMVSAGTLAVSGASVSISNSALMVNGGVFDMTNASIPSGFVFITNLSGTGGSIFLGNNSLRFAGSSAGQYDGLLTSTTLGSLALFGSNTLTLTGANTGFLGTIGLLGKDLVLSGGGSLPNAVIFLNGSDFDISGISAGSTSVANIASANPGYTITLGNKILEIGSDNGSRSSIALFISNSDAGGVTKVGAGTLTLTGNSTGYSGITTISAGTLALSGSGTIGQTIVNSATFSISAITPASISIDSVSGSGAISLGAKTLILGASDSSMAISGAISGASGGLTKQGTGTLTLSAVNTYTGLTTVSAGTLTLSSTGSLAGNTTVSSGATFNVNNTIGSTLTNSGDVYILGSNTNYSATSVVNNSGGVFDIAGLTAPGINLGNITGAGNIVMGTKSLSLTAPSGTVSGAISGSGSLGMVGAAPTTWTLTNANAGFSGPVSVFAGTLALSGSGTPGSGGIFLVTTGALDISGISGSSLSIQSLQSEYSATTVSLGSKTLIVGELASLSQTYAGLIQDGGIAGGTGGGLTSSSTGTFTLTQANTYTGNTTVTAGTLALSGNASLAASTVVVNTGIFSITEVNTSATIAGLSGSGGSVALGTKNLIVNTSVTTTYDGTISGTNTSNALTKSGSGTLTLTGNNSSYTGMTTVTAGTLALSGSGTLPSSITVNGGIFSISAVTTSATIASLAGSGGTVALGTKNLIVNTSTVSSYAGTISGSNATNALTKSGIGNLTLTGNNSSYTGMTVISAGNLLLSGGGALPGGMTVNGGSFDISGVTTSATISSLTGSGGIIALGAKNLILNTSTTTSYAGTFTGTNTTNAFTLNSTDIFTLTANSSSYTGMTTISAGTLSLSGSGNLPGGMTISTGSFNISGVTTSASVSSLAGAGGTTVVLGDKALQIGASNGLSTTYSGVISGSGSSSLVKTGTNTITLAGTNTYTGITTISVGNLNVTGSIAGTATVAGGTFSLQTSGSIAGRVTINTGSFDITAVTTSATVASFAGTGGQINIGTKTLIAGTDNTSTSYAGALVGTGEFNKSGTGTLTLTGNSTNFTGNTTVSDGTLTLDAGGILGSLVTVDASKDFIVQGVGSHVTSGRTITNNGTTTVTTNGSLSQTTIVNNATLSFTTAGSANNAAINNTGTASFDASSATSATIQNTGGSLTFANISGANNSNITNSATLSFTSGSTANGATINNSGTASFNASSATGSATHINNNAGTFTFLNSSVNNANVANNATLDFTGTSTASFSIFNNIAGTTTFEDTSSIISAVITNAATLAFIDSSTASGSTISNSGTLTFADTSTAGNAAVTNNGDFDISAVTASLSIGSLSGNGTVDLGSKALSAGSLNTSTTYSGLFTGLSGSAFTKTGSGVFTLNSTGNQIDLTTVAAGTFILGDAAHSSFFANEKTFFAPASLIGDVVVNAGALLGGHGIIIGDLTNNGFVLPGNLVSATTFTVDGNYIQNSSGQLNINFAQNGQANILAVTGDATLAGGIAVNTNGQALGFNNFFVVMTIDGTRTGEFQTVETSSFFQQRITYSEHEVFFSYSYNPANIIAVLETPNQRAVANYLLDTFGNVPISQAVDVAGSAQNLQVLLDQISGASYANQQTEFAQIARQFEDQLADRLDIGRVCVEERRDRREKGDRQPFICRDQLGWITVYGGEDDISTSKDASGLITNLWGFAAGWDYPLSEEMILGAAVGYASYNDKSTGHEITTGGGDAYQFGIYSRYEMDAWRFGIAADYASSNDVTMQRQIYNGTTYLETEGNYKQILYGLQGRGSYVMEMDAGFVLQPFFGGIYQQVYGDVFSETGNPGFALQVTGNNYKSMRTQLGFGSGFNTERELFFSDVSLFLFLSWEHEFLDQTSTFSAYVIDVAIPGSFTISGTDIGRDFAVIKTGVAFFKQFAWELSLGYQGRFGSNFGENMAIVQLNF